MNIGAVYSPYYGEAPYTPGQRVDYRNLGKIVPQDMAPDHCPMLYFKLPITRPVTVAIWNASSPNGIFTRQEVLVPWLNTELLQYKQELHEQVGRFAPRLSSVVNNPPKGLVLQLQYAIEYWQPFTSLVAALKLLPVLIAMSPEESADFLGRIGLTQNQRKLRVVRQKAFINSCWVAWEQAELSYEERVRNMEKNGVPIKLESFKKLAKREMKLNRLFHE